MKINTNSTGFKITAIGLPAFALIMLFMIFPVNSLYITTPITKINNPNISPNIQNGPITTGSVVNTTAVYTQPPTINAIQNALDSAGCKDNNGICAASSQKLLVNTQVVLFDSNQKQYQSSIFTNIPAQSFLPWSPKVSITDIKNNLIYSIPQISPLALVDPQGHLLDLGSVQLALYGATTVDTNIVMSGQFAVYLDDVLRYSGSVATQGTTVNKLIPLQIGNKPAFTFTFADEGKNWTNGTTHYFKVYVGNVTASVGSGTSTQTFQYTKNALVYVLAMTLNSDKKVMLGVDNKAIAIFKSDDSIETCGRNGIVTFQALGPIYQQYYTGSLSQPARNTGLVSIYQNGFLITSIQSTNTNPNYNPANPDSVDSNSGAGLKSCVTKTGIPRDTDLLVTIGTNQYNIHTPVTQTTLIYDCSGDAVSGDPFTGTTRTSCPSNFISK